jgi:hypothetical protein
MSKQFYNNLLFILCFSVSSFAQVSVLTQRNSNDRTSLNSQERLLTTTNVNVNQFGKLFTLPVDAQVYAQPLIVSGVNIPGKGIHNVVYIATENDSAYAFDAETGGAPFWKQSLGAPANCVYGCTSGNLYPLTGITATPVIDPATNTLYVAALDAPTPLGQKHMLHALDLATGAEKFGGPVRITATVPGTGEGGTSLTYSEIHQRLRPALGLVNGQVIVGTGSYDDWGPYHGWVFAYDAATLHLNHVWVSTPNGNGASPWESGNGFVADQAGNIYLITGNGDFDGKKNFGQSVVKLSLNGGLALTDYFTPFNYATMNASDIDLGSSGPLHIPGTNYLVGGGKQGKLYLLDMNDLGKYNSGTDLVLQEFQAVFGNGTGHIHGTPAFWTGPTGSFIYLWGENDRMRAFSFANGLFDTTPTSMSVATSPAITPPNGMPGGFISVSSNGTQAGTGIVWATTPYQGDAESQTVPGILRAFDASDLNRELWNSNLNQPRDGLGNFAKFVPPTIANGKVYTATFSNQVSVYGVLPTFWLTSPAPFETVNGSGNATFPLTVGTVSGFTGPISLSASTSSSNLSVAISPATLPGAGTSILTVTASSQAAPGAYTILVSATSAGITRQITLSLTVNGFNFSARPSYLSLQPGTTGSVTLKVDKTSGFTGPVTLTVPSGTTATITPSSVSVPGTATMLVSAAATLAPGVYPINVKAKGGTESLIQTVYVSVSSIGLAATNAIVAAAPNHSLTYQVTLSGAVAAGTSLSVSGLPSKWKYAFNPPAPTKAGPVTLTVTPAAGTPLGAFPFTVVAAGAGAGTNSLIATALITPDGNISKQPMRIDVGGGNAGYTDTSSNFWQGDTCFFGGGTFTSSATVGNTSDPSLYQTLRGGSFSYRWALPNGAYTVTLKFADMIATQPGARVFSVAANGNTVLNGIDIVKLAGANNALSESFPVNLTNGQLSLEFSSLLGLPIVNAIQVR